MKKLLTLLLLLTLTISCTIDNAIKESLPENTVIPFYYNSKYHKDTFPFNSYEEAISYLEDKTPYTGDNYTFISNTVTDYLSNPYILTSKRSCNVTSRKRSFTHELFMVSCDDGTDWMVLTHNGEIGEIYQL